MSGCSGKLQVEDKSPLSANVIRLGDTAVAEVEGTNIYLSDVEHAALAKGLMVPGMSLTPKDPVFQSQLDELIDQRLLALDALRQSFDQNDETRRRLAASRELILSNIVIENLLAEKINDETLQRMYAEQSALRTDMKQVRARHILVESEEKAIEIAELLENGGDFSELAKQMSLDMSTRDLGGDLSYFSRGSMEDNIADQAFALGRGEISAPFNTARGWHLLKVEAIRATPQPAFEDIKSEIVSFMTYDEIEKKLKSLRAQSQIELKLGQADPVPEANDGP
jgi:peptidyl-prolyl cis-trans isomerase C